jgi:tRNA1Val (adenine37-N6)-methyltransferase
MPNPWFQFKQFTVWHDKCAMKVGTDGVLLGAWAEVEDAKSILDVGTGSGLISLMAAQRNSKAAITAIDIEESAIIQARENFDRSPWAGRLRAIPVSLEDFAGSTDATFDVIISNPPYFQQSLHSPNEKRTLARHATHLTPESLLFHCAKLLSPDGSIHLILPIAEGNNLLGRIDSYHLFCIRQTVVLPTPASVPKRLLISLKFCYEPVKNATLTIETGVRYQYSEDFIRLLQSFYLKL